MAEEIDRAWWSQLRRELMREFVQEDIPHPQPRHLALT
jgi:hypothetical protein